MFTHKKIKILLIVLTLIIVTVIGLLLRGGNKQFIKIDTLTNNNNDYNIIQDLQIDSITKLKDFPYNKYLNSENIGNVKSIDKSLNILSSIIQDTLSAQDTLSKALTIMLYKKYSPKEYDTLNMFLNWSDNLLLLAEKNKANKYFYKGLNDYWYTEIAKCIENKKIDKYNFKYRYLSQKCQDKKYNVDTEMSTFDKVIFNIIEGKLSYVLKRFWGNTGVIFKIFIFLGIVITLFSYYTLIKNIKSKLKNKNEKK